MREEPKLFIAFTSSPIAFAMTMSFAANGLCVLIAPRSAALIPALSRAICAEGATAAAMYAFFVRANPKETIRISIFGSALSSFAFSRVVTQTPQLPSAGYVWVPYVCAPSGRTGLNPANPSLVEGKTPSSAATVIVFFLESWTSTGNMYRFWNSRSFASPSWYCSCRRRVIASHSARVTPCSLLTFSAVWIIAPPAQGSFPKLSMTQSSEIIWPPGPPGLGQEAWGPLEQRSARRTQPLPKSPVSIPMPAW